MTGLPTLTVKLDDGTGTYPYDITQYVRMPDGWSFNRGRGDEYSDVQTGTLNLSLDNTDGRFTFGSVTYAITTDRLVRLQETVGGTTYTRYTGYIETVPSEWPDGGDAFSVVRLTAVDRLARFGRRKLRSMTENEIGLDAPNAYYTLGEPAGALSAGDTSGNGRPTLVPTGTGTAATFGATGANAWDGLTAGAFVGGGYLRGTTNYISTASSVSILVAFQVTVAPFSGTGAELTLVALLSQTPSTSPNGPQIGMASNGTLKARADSGLTIITSAGTYADGVWHVAELVASGTTWTLYVDGASVGSAVTTAMPTTGIAYDLLAGLDSDFPAGASRSSIDNVAVYPVANSAARVLAHANAIRNGFATDTADQRWARLLSYGNVATANQNLETGQQTSIAAQSTTGASLLTALQAVTQAENGVFFIAGDGKATGHNKSHRVLKATGAAAIALTADQVNPDISFGGEKTYLYNTATGSRSGGATQRSVNAASVTAYEEYPVDRSVALLPTDELLLNMLTWLTTIYSSPRSRVGALVLDLLTLPQATVQALLALEIGDRITLGSLPAQSPVTTADLIVEGYNEQQTHASWTLTLNTVPSTVYRAWILQDATYGVLDSTTVLYL